MNLLNIDLYNLIIFIVIGFIAGWMAGRIIKGKGFSILGNIVLGVIGSLVGKSLFSFAGQPLQIRIGEFCVAFVGAIVLAFLMKFIQNKE